MKTYVIYRDDKKQILKYSIHSKSYDEISDLITKYNESSKNQQAEIVSSDDLICLIGISEENKKIKEYDLRQIEDHIDSLQNEFFLLKEAVTIK